MRRTRNKTGYIVITGPSRHSEADTATCKHCNRVFVVRSNDPKIKVEVGDLCKMCMKIVCPQCAVSGKPCVPFEERLTQYEQRAKLFRDMEL